MQTPAGAHDPTIYMSDRGLVVRFDVVDPALLFPRVQEELLGIVVTVSNHSGGELLHEAFWLVDPRSGQVRSVVSLCPAYNTGSILRRTPCHPVEEADLEHSALGFVALFGAPVVWAGTPMDTPVAACNDLAPCTYTLRQANHTGPVASIRVVTDTPILDPPGPAFLMGAGVELSIEQGSRLPTAVDLGLETLQLVRHGSLVTAVDSVHGSPATLEHASYQASVCPNCSSLPAGAQAKEVAEDGWSFGEALQTALTQSLDFRSAYEHPDTRLTFIRYGGRCASTTLEPQEACDRDEQWWNFGLSDRKPSGDQDWMIEVTRRPLVADDDSALPLYRENVLHDGPPPPYVHAVRQFDADSMWLDLEDLVAHVERLRAAAGDDRPLFLFDSTAVASSAGEGAREATHPSFELGWVGNTQDSGSVAIMSFNWLTVSAVTGRLIDIRAPDAVVDALSGTDLSGFRSCQPQRVACMPR